MQPQAYSFIRYLESKKSVDDRALNRHVWESLHRRVESLRVQRPLRVLEVGAGIGTMVERVLDWGLWGGDLHYTTVDADADSVAAARERLQRWGHERGVDAETSTHEIAFSGRGRRVIVQPEAADAFEFATRPGHAQGWDLLIAHAFLDLVDVPSALPRLLRLLRPSGVFYLTLNFDGLTILEPAIDPAYDDHLVALYHDTMDERLVGGKPSGDSRTGRHLFEQIRAAGARIIDAGSSDWVVFPGNDGYPHDEAYFLHFIVHTIGTALGAGPSVDPPRFERWIAQRHAQIEQKSLVYIAHQMDFVGELSAAD
jgi:SAM-dependent methyltransferase